MPRMLPFPSWNEHALPQAKGDVVSRPSLHNPVGELVFSLQCRKLIKGIRKVRTPDIGVEERTVASISLSIQMTVSVKDGNGFCAYKAQGAN